MKSKNIIPKIPRFLKVDPRTETELDAQQFQLDKCQEMSLY